MIQFQRHPQEEHLQPWCPHEALLLVPTALVVLGIVLGWASPQTRVDLGMIIEMDGIVEGVQEVAEEDGVEVGVMVGVVKTMVREAIEAPRGAKKVGPMQGPLKGVVGIRMQGQQVQEELLGLMILEQQIQEEVAGIVLQVECPRGVITGVRWEPQATALRGLGVGGKVVLEVGGTMPQLLPVVLGRMGQVAVDKGEQGGIKDGIVVEVGTKEAGIKQGRV